MPLDIGPGVDAYLKSIQATPQSNESYLGPDFPCSSTAFVVGDADGIHKVRNLVGWDKEVGALILPGPGVQLPLPHSSITTMYDSVHPSSIPDWAQAVAGYVNGAVSVWPKSAWDRFIALGLVLGETLLRIDVNGTQPNISDVLDIERGDVDPSDARTIGDWLDIKINSGIQKPRLYCNTSSIAAVRVSAGGRPFRWWAAHYTGVAHQEPGADGTQWTDPSTGSGGDYDLSEVNDDFLAAA